MIRSGADFLICDHEHLTALHILIRNTVRQKDKYELYSKVWLLLNIYAYPIGCGTIFYFHFLMLFDRFVSITSVHAKFLKLKSSDCSQPSKKVRLIPKTL